MLLAWLAAAFVAGIVLGSWSSPPESWLLLCAAAAPAISRLPRLRAATLPSLVVAALCLGCARGEVASSPPTRGDLAHYNGRTVTVTGVVSAEPDVRDTGANYVVSADSVVVGGRSRTVSGGIELHVPLSQELAYGEAVSLTGKLRTPSRGSSFDYRSVLARRGIFSTMEFVRVRDLGSRNEGISGWIQSVRTAIERGIDAWVPEPEASLLVAITLGARSATLGDLAPSLVATGLIHIIAISGIKVAMVAGTMYELARLARRRLLTLALALISLYMYVLLTGSTVSGIRSAVMWALVFVAAYLGRTTASLVSLAVAAAGMVALQPDLISDIAFQLSTIGTFSIVALTPPLVRGFGRVPSPLRESLCVTLAAQIGTLPIVAIGFGQVSLIGPIANALVLPLLPLLIACGFAIGALASIAPAAALVGAFTDGLLRLVSTLASALDRFPSVHVPGAVAPLLVIVYYAALAAACSWVLHASHWAPIGQWSSRGRELLVAGVAGLLVLSASVTIARGSQETRVVWLGSGEAILIDTPHRAVLIDGSPHPLSLLRRLGRELSPERRRLDLLVVDDPRASNVIGLRAVLRRYTVRQVLDVGTEYPSTTYASWRSDLRESGIPAFALRRRSQVNFDGVRITAIAPDGPCSRSQDCGGIVRLDGWRHHLLLAGPASIEQQREALFRHVPISAQILVTTSAVQPDPGFIRAVGSASRLLTFPGVPLPHTRLREHTPVVIAHWTR